MLRSFSVYSWNFRMVLRRLHAEYGVNAFFRVDVVAHPNFPDKSIVRVSLPPFQTQKPRISRPYHPTALSLDFAVLYRAPRVPGQTSVGTTPQPPPTPLPGAIFSRLIEIG